MGYYYYNPQEQKPPERKRNIISIVLVIFVIALSMLIAGILVFGWDIQDQGINGSGIDISRDPVQFPYIGEAIIRDIGGIKYTITPVTSYEISAKVKSIKLYQDNNRLSQMDICAVWGELASESNLSYSQRSRFCYVDAIGDIQIDKERFGFLSTYKLSNNHIIPANDTISSDLNTIKVEDNIKLTGYLVNVDGDEGYQWKTSLSRHDEGYGACEIIYVTEVKKLA